MSSPHPGALRCFFHAATGLVLTLLIARIGKAAGLWILGGCLGLTVLAEMVRLSIPSVNRFLISWVKPVLKEKEKTRPSGISYFLAGGWIVLLLCDFEIALASLVILSVGDPAAAFVGRRWGRLRIGQKSLEGTLSFFVCSLAAGWLFLGLDFGYTMPLFAIGTAAAAAAELLPLKIDDNLILPLAAGLAMQGASPWF